MSAVSGLRIELLLSGFESMQEHSAIVCKRRIGLLICVWLFSSHHTQILAEDFPPSTKTVPSKPSDRNNILPLKKENSNGSTKPPSDSSLPPAKIKWLPNDDNILVRMPADATLEGYNKWLEDERNKPAGPQSYTISEIDIDGVADDERATLTVTFTVRLPQGEHMERVPLFFNDAVLLSKPTYVGDGEEIGGKKDPKQGHVWWFKGKGPHRLKFLFSVPLQKPLPSRHLMISLPTSAISHIKMTLPFSSVKPTVLPEQSIVLTNPAGEGKTCVEVIGLKEHLDLSWQPNIDVRPNEVSMEVQSTIHAQIDTDHALLRVHQKMNSLYGQFDTLTVTLPNTAELISLDGPDKPSWTFDPENRQRIVISFKEHLTSTQFNWTLRLPIKLKTPVTIDGFVVEGERLHIAKHVGIIGLSITDGLPWTERRNSTIAASNQNLQSTHLGEFPAALGPVLRAYKFVAQPFKLVTVFEEVKAYFEVKPEIILSATAQQLVLDAKFEIRVDRHRLNEVVLTWPNHKSEAWTIDNVEEPGVVESYTVDEKGQITIRLVKHFSKTLAVRVRAHRQFKNGEEISFSLPRPKSASLLSPSSLLLINAENIESDLTARGETVFQPLPSSSVELASLPQGTKGLKIMPYRIDTDEQSFALRVIPQKQRIRSETSVDVTWDENQFHFEQRLIYHIDYERLSQIRLIVPQSVDPSRCRFQSTNGNFLNPEQTPTRLGSRQIIQLKLSEAQLGRLEIKVTYSSPFKRDPSFDTEALVDLPFFESADEPFSFTRVALTQSDWFDAEPISAETWRPQRGRQDAWEWMAEGSQFDLPLKLIRSARGSETGTVSLALVKAVLDETGDGTIQAQFRVSTRTSHIPVQLPPNAKSARFSWDGRQLANRECMETPIGSLRYVVEPERSGNSPSMEHLLTITYNEKFSPPMSWSDRILLRSPILTNCSWNQVLWEVVLPAGHHLWTYPPSAASLFHWRRTGLIWSRISDCNSETLQQVITQGTSVEKIPNVEMADVNGNSYLFRQLDSPKPLVFQTLSSSMALLVGAGCTLLAGFVMLRVGVLRHVLTVMLLAIAIAVVGLWYSAPLELLLQPMIVGFLFAVAAVILDSWIRQRYDTRILSFDRQGDFPPLQAFGGSHYIVRQTDPNEVTLHRPVNHENESSLKIESGSGVS